MKYIKKTSELIFVSLLAAITSLSFVIFIFPNSFAPAGVDGVCTMIQDITGVSMGYLSLLVNIPLLIVSWIYLSRDYAVKTTLFVVVFSTVTAVLSNVDLGNLYYYTESNTSIVLAPIASGVIRGIIYALSIWMNCSSGGIDIIAALIKRKSPHFNLMNIIFAINICVAIMSYFVYGNQLEPVICGILYFYITSATSSSIQSGQKENAKVEIITSEAKKVCSEIITKLQLSATILDTKGAYSGSAGKMVVCIAPKKYVPQIKDIVNQTPNSIYFVSIVGESNTRRY